MERLKRIGALETTRAIGGRHAEASFPHARVQKHPGEAWSSFGSGTSGLGSERLAIAALTAAGCTLEATLLWASLGPFSLAHHGGLYAPGQNTLTWTLGEGAGGFASFIIFLASLIVSYVVACSFAQRVSGRTALVIAFAGALVFGLTALAMFPADAQDIFHNIMDGRLLWLYHLNPLVTAPNAVPFDPLYRYLTAWQESPSAYGPLWFVVTGPAALFPGTGRDANIIAFKAVPFVFELISLVLIALLARRMHRGYVAAAVVSFGWNPLVLWEIAGNGHNDVVMLTFVLLAILALLSTRWPLAFPLLACSVLVKYVSAILFPVFILWAFRRYGRHSLIPLAAGLAGAAAIALITFAPFWVGPSTFAQLRLQQNQVFLSVAAALIGTVGKLVPNTTHVVVVKTGLTLAFLLLYGRTLLWTEATDSGIVRAAVEILFVYLVLMTWWFFPWYVVWALALAAILPGSAHFRMIMLFSVTAMVAYSIAWAGSVRIIAIFAIPLVTALVIFFLPVLVTIRHLRTAR